MKALTAVRLVLEGTILAGSIVVALLTFPIDTPPADPTVTIQSIALHVEPLPGKAASAGIGFYAAARGMTHVLLSGSNISELEASVDAPVGTWKPFADDCPPGWTCKVETLGGTVKPFVIATRSQSMTDNVGNFGFDLLLPAESAPGSGAVVSSRQAYAAIHIPFVYVQNSPQTTMNVGFALPAQRTYHWETDNGTSVQQRLVDPATWEGSFVSLQPVTHSAPGVDVLVADFDIPLESNEPNGQRLANSADQGTTITGSNEAQVIADSNLTFLSGISAGIGAAALLALVAELRHEPTHVTTSRRARQGKVRGKAQRPIHTQTPDGRRRSSRSTGAKRVAE